MDIMHTLCLRCNKPAVSIPFNCEKYGMKVSYTHYSYCEDCLREGLKMLKNGEKKKGKWLPKKASIYPYGYDVQCSECGLTMGSTFGYKFCPLCGAKMEGGDME